MKLCFVVTGNTYPVREILKGRGYKWDAKAKAWVAYLDHDEDCNNELEKQALLKLGVNVDVSDADYHYDALNGKTTPKATPAPLPTPEPMTTPDGSWTYDKMRELIQKDDRAVAAALITIYNKQTEDEKRSGETTKSNGVGFRANHARRGTYYANWLLSGRKLSGVHVDKARHIALHYVQQLIDIANNKR